MPKGGLLCIYTTWGSVLAWSQGLNGEQLFDGHKVRGGGEVERGGGSHHSMPDRSKERVGCLAQLLHSDGDQGLEDSLAPLQIKREDMFVKAFQTVWMMNSVKNGLVPKFNARWRRCHCSKQPCKLNAFVRDGILVDQNLNFLFIKEL